MSVAARCRGRKCRRARDGHRALRSAEERCRALEIIDDHAVLDAIASGVIPSMEVFSSARPETSNPSDAGSMRAVGQTMIDHGRKNRADLIASGRDPDVGQRRQPRLALCYHDEARAPRDRLPDGDGSDGLLFGDVRIDDKNGIRVPYIRRRWRSMRHARAHARALRIPHPRRQDRTIRSLRPPHSASAESAYASSFVILGEPKKAPPESPADAALIASSHGDSLPLTRGARDPLAERAAEAEAAAHAEIAFVHADARCGSDGDKVSGRRAEIDRAPCPAESAGRDRRLEIPRARA